MKRMLSWEVAGLFSR